MKREKVAVPVAQAGTGTLALSTQALMVVSWHTATRRTRRREGRRIGRVEKATPLGCVLDVVEPKMKS